MPTQSRTKLFWHIKNPGVSKLWLRRAAATARRLSLRHPGPHTPVLPMLDQIDISFIDNTSMIRTHADFLQDPTPTDVITFPHGEILIDAHLAQTQAQIYTQTLPEELLLYIIHGFLHLNGHEDATTAEAATMKTLQEQILQEIVTNLQPPAYKPSNSDTLDARQKITKLHTNPPPNSQGAGPT